MSKITKKESPLHYIKDKSPITFGLARIRAEEIAYQGYLNLRGNIADMEFKQKIEGIIGVEIPNQVNQVNRNNEYSIYWLSPDEWLISTEEDGELALERNIRDALGDMFFAITNVSGGFTTIKIAGSEVRAVLSKGTSLDIDLKKFPVGSCAQTHLAQTVMILSSVSKDGFEIIVRRSFAEYLWLFLHEAASEFNC